MGTYLENLVKNLLENDDAQFAIEHKNKNGWFMFDIDQIDNRTEIVWTKDYMLSLRWETKKTAAEFIQDVNISEGKVNIVDVGEL